MKLRHLFFIIFLLFVIIQSTSISAQVAINENGASPDPSAMLDLQSLDKGLLMPRMTTDQREAISNPAEGLVVYDTDTKSFLYFDNSEWRDLSATSGRSIFIAPSSIADVSLSGASSRGRISFNITIDMPENQSSSLFFNLPIPADFIDGFTTAKILYTSNNNAGSFGVGFSSTAFSIGDDLSQTSAEILTSLPAPSSANLLMVESIPFGAAANPDNNVEFIVCRLQRFDNNEPLDTSTGNFSLVGIVLEYQGE